MQRRKPDPLVLYTDLASGPNSGGENNNGTYLSVFGKNFGDSAGLRKRTKVFIGGIEVADYRYLGPSMGRPDIQQITVQIGALANLRRESHCRSKCGLNGAKSWSFAPSHSW